MKNEDAEAVGLYERAIGLGAEDKDIHYKLAMGYWRQGQMAEGIASPEEHLRLHPDDGRAMRLRGLLQHGQKREASP